MCNYFNLYSNKILAGVFSGFFAMFVENLAPLVFVAAVFEAVDFFTGCWKSSVLAKRRGEKFAFESVKAWRTIYKIVFITMGIVLSEMLDKTITEDTRLRLANWFTAFVCGVEFWSFLENAAVISDHPIFRWLRRYMKDKVEDKIGMTLEEAQKEE